MAGLPNSSNALQQWHHLFEAQGGPRTPEASQHLQQLLRLGLPTRKHEDWKYTPLDALLNGRFVADEGASLSAEQRDALALPLDAWRLVFIDGRYALRLAYGNGEYLIHGTNAPDSVGLRVSSGCMRMNADDIKALFSQVKTGTPVRIINQPVKFAVEPDGKRYVEVHRPLSQTEGENTRTIAYTLPAAFHAFAEDKAVDDLQLKKAMSRRAGYPVVVSAGAGSAATSLSAQNSSSDNGLLTQ